MNDEGRLSSCHNIGRSLHRILSTVYCSTVLRCVARLMLSPGGSLTPLTATIIKMAYTYMLHIAFRQHFPFCLSILSKYLVAFIGRPTKLLLQQRCDRSSANKRRLFRVITYRKLSGITNFYHISSKQKLRVRLS